MSHAFLNNKWIILGLPMVGILIGVLSCAKESATNNSGATIEKQLAFEDIAISIDSPQEGLGKLPEFIQVQFKNISSKRGYLPLPSLLRGQPHSEYSIPSIAIGMRYGEEGSPLAGEPHFLYSPKEAEQVARSSVAVMDARTSITVKYPLASFCLIGHGIAPDPLANLLSCYRPGNIKTDMRVYLITDWNKFTTVASNSIAVNLSEPDFSKHHDSREATHPEQQNDDEDPDQ